MCVCVCVYTHTHTHIILISFFSSLNFLAQGIFFMHAGQQHPTWDTAGLNTIPDLVRKCLLLMVHRHLCFLSHECEFYSKCFFIIPSKDISFTFSFSIAKYMIIWRKKKWRSSFFDPIKYPKIKTDPRVNFSLFRSRDVFFTLIIPPNSKT